MTHEIETKQNLFQALKETRQQSGGIPLFEIAEIMREVFDEEELNHLIRKIKI